MLPRLLRSRLLLLSCLALAVCLLTAAGRSSGKKKKRRFPKHRKSLRGKNSDADFDRYLKRAKQLKKRRDTGDLNEGDVLDVLRDAGLFDTKSMSGRGGHKSFAQGFRPFEVRVYRGLWRWPLNAGIVSSEYGKRWGKRHQGIDIAADSGVAILAAAPGEVIYASNTLRGYGNTVILRHDNSTTSLYAHCKKLLVKKGKRVWIGHKIALLGSTGHSTGPHIHFEIRRKRKPLNPRKVLPKTRF